MENLKEAQKFLLTQLAYERNKNHATVRIAKDRLDKELGEVSSYIASIEVSYTNSVERIEWLKSENDAYKEQSELYGQEMEKLKTEIKELEAKITEMTPPEKAPAKTTRKPRSTKKK